MSRFNTNWDWRFAQTLKFVRSKGPVYFTRKGSAAYAIHWGLPTGEVVLPGFMAKPGSAVRMLGVDRDLVWQQRGRDVVVQVPEKLPCKYAVSFVLQPAR
jgi:alpha-L-fucosidase